jgi:membrane protease YdiL (CAAX protease family)
VRKEARQDVLKVWIYAVAVISLGAWTSPFFYNAGKALAEVTGDKRTNGILQTLGHYCRIADFPAFFVASMVLMAVVCFFPFAEWLALKRERVGESGQRLRANRRGFLEWISGMVFAAALFGAIGYGLLATGSFAFRNDPGSFQQMILHLLPWVLLGTVVQEGFFRGVVLGVFLRGMGVVAAISTAAAFFAVAHLLVPPHGLNVPDPDASGVGLGLLRLIGSRLADPVVLLNEVVPLLALGSLLGYARWRTASLWLPAGIHAGWVLASGLFSGYTQSVPRSDFLARVLAGGSPVEGLIPLAGLVIVGTLVYFLTDSATGSSASDA